MQPSDSQPPRPRTDVLLERTVVGIILFLAVTSVVVRLWLVVK
jgi:hypothetical protein